MIRHEAQPCGKKSSDLGSDNQHDEPGLAQTLAFEPERLRLARELKEWSQAELAARLDVTPAAVSRFETGVTRPRHGRAGPDDQRAGRSCTVLLAARYRNL